MVKNEETENFIYALVDKLVKSVALEALLVRDRPFDSDRGYHFKVFCVVSECAGNGFLASLDGGICWFESSHSDSTHKY